MREQRTEANTVGQRFRYRRGFRVVFLWGSPQTCLRCVLVCDSLRFRKQKYSWLRCDIKCSQSIHKLEFLMGKQPVSVILSIEKSTESEQPFVEIADLVNVGFVRRFVSSGRRYCRVLFRLQAHESKRGNINKSKVQKESCTTCPELKNRESYYGLFFWDHPIFTLYTGVYRSQHP